MSASHTSVVVEMQGSSSAITTTRVVVGGTLDLVGKKLPGKPENFTRAQAEAIRATLRVLREKYDNQTLLASAIGVTQQNVSRLCAPNGVGLTYTTATSIVRLAGYDGVDTFFAELGLDGLQHDKSEYSPTLQLAVSIARRLSIPDRIIAAVIEQAGGPSTVLRTPLWVDRMIMRNEAERDARDGIPAPPPSARSVAQGQQPAEKPARKRA